MISSRTHPGRRKELGMLNGERLHLSRGFTSVEFLMAMGIAGILLAQVCSLWFYSTRSFAAQLTYTELDQNSQKALDHLSRALRQVKELTSFNNTNEMVFKDFDDQPLTYRLTGKKIVRIKGAERTTVLSDCDWIHVSIFQRNPVEGAYDQYPAADVSSCKLVELRWKCSREPYPMSPTTTEYMQSAKIVIRGK